MNPQESASSKSVLIVEDDHDLSYSYASVIKTLIRWDVILSNGLADLKARDSKALTCEVALLDIDLGPGRPSGLEAYQWLLNQGFNGRVCFITGHASSHPLVTKAVNLKVAHVLSKPIGIEELIREITGKTSEK